MPQVFKKRERELRPERRRWHRVWWALYVLGLVFKTVAEFTILAELGEKIKKEIDAGT